MSNFLSLTHVFNSKYKDLSVKILAFVFITTLACILLTKPFARVSEALLVLSSLFTFLLNKEQIKPIYKASKNFYFTLILFFTLSTLVGLYHFGLSKDLVFQLKKMRWVLYAITILPALVYTKTYIDSDVKLQKRLTTGLHILYYISIFIIFEVLSKQYLNFSFFEENPKFHMFKGRASWTYNPNTFSRISLFFSFLFILTSTFERSKLHKYLALILSALFFYITLISYSRALWLGLAVAAFLLLLKLISYNKKSFLLFLTLFLGATIFFFSSTKNLKRLKSIQNTTQFSIQHRLQLWRANIGYIKSSPFVGIGYGENKKKKRLLNSFDEDFKTKYKRLGSFLITSPHNEYLDVAASFGLPVLFLFIFFLFKVLIYYFKCSSINHKHLQHLLALLFLSTFAIAICFDSIGYDNWIILLIALLPMLYNKHKSLLQKK